MDDRLLCVIYEDHYFTGSVYGEYLALRTRVIDLETAEVYDVQDVLRADETFVDLWRAKDQREGSGQLSGGGTLR